MSEGIVSVTCTRCKDVIDVPAEDVTRGSVTNYCRCGLTFVTKGKGYTSWGGPGKPGHNEADPHEESRPSDDITFTAPRGMSICYEVLFDTNTGRILEFRD